MSLGILSSFGFGTPEMDEVFSPGSIVDRMLRFEAALALALADAGLAPGVEAQAVADACAEPLPDPDGLLATTWEAGTPVIALVGAVGERIADGESRRWLHHGATSQDVVDTANMLLAREGLDVLEGLLIRSAKRLRALVEEHREQPQMGRTFLQHAMPTTFGWRAAFWLDGFIDQLGDLRAIRVSLPAQLGGPVGNLAAYGDRGADVITALADRLDLSRPVLAWHVDRSIVSKLAGVVERSVATAGKVAVDIALLAQAEVGEVTVRTGGSSSMPAKRNPIDAIHALAAADVCHGAARMLTASRPHELDRALGAWHVEWAALPLLFGSAAATHSAVATLLETLEVNGAAMAAVVESGPGEAVGLDPRLIDAVLARYDEVVGRA